MKVRKGTELMICGENKIGLLQSIAEEIAHQNINIRALSAWHVEEKAFIRMVTSDNASVQEVLTKAGLSCEQNPVIIAELIDKVGQLCTLTFSLKEANIDLTHLYGSTGQSLAETLIVFATSDNEKALKVLSQ